MIDAGFVEALNHSIDRLNGGESIANCLRRYPQYAVGLAPLLEVGQVVRRAQVDASEATQARERQRERFERALNQPVSLQPTRALHSLGRLVATIVLIFVLMSGGASLLAESSLPGDLLYSLKLWTESVRVTLTNYDPVLQATFATRRIEEARQLVELRRSAEMTFTGTVQAVDSDGLWIEGLLVRVENRQLPLGSRVEVEVRSTEQGELIAVQIRVLDEPTNVPPLTLEPTPVRRLTEDAVFTNVPTAAPTISVTMTAESQTDQSPPFESRSEGRTECLESPVGWVRYLIQPGDTLSALAVASSGTIDDIMVANCLENARSIIAGQIIFLPRPVMRTSTRPPATDTPFATAVPSSEVIRPEPTRPNDR